MTTRTIPTPRGWNLSDLLAIIETTRDAFTSGRRNNDMVNWFIVKALQDLEAGNPIRPRSHYVEDFEELVQRMTPIQQSDISSWEVDYDNKVEILWNLYSWGATEMSLSQLWLPMPYTLVD